MTISMLVSCPWASLEQHARKCLTTNSYRRASFPWKKKEVLKCKGTTKIGFLQEAALLEGSRCIWLGGWEDGRDQFCRHCGGWALQIPGCHSQKLTKWEHEKIQIKMNDNNIVCETRGSLFHISEYMYNVYTNKLLQDIYVCNFRAESDISSTWLDFLKFCHPRNPMHWLLMLTCCKPNAKQCQAEAVTVARITHQYKKNMPELITKTQIHVQHIIISDATLTSPLRVVHLHLNEIMQV